MDVPLVPAGARGTVLTTTMFGRPKKVFFAVSDGWGVKRFHVIVRRGNVEWHGQASTDGCWRPNIEERNYTTVWF